MSFIKAIIFCVTFFYIFSCNSDKGREKNISAGDKSPEACEFISYVLPSSVSEFVKDSILSRKEIYYAYFSSNHDDEEIILTLIYTSKSDKMKALSNKTNRKLLIDNYEIPVLFETDFLYSKEAEDSLHYIEDFNFATLKFTEQGEIVDHVIF